MKKLLILLLLLSCCSSNNSPSKFKRGDKVCVMGKYQGVVWYKRIMTDTYYVDVNYGEKLGIRNEIFIESELTEGECPKTN